jgi:hypothetical protein
MAVIAVIPGSGSFEDFLSVKYHCMTWQLSLSSKKIDVMSHEFTGMLLVKHIVLGTLEPKSEEQQLSSGT